MANLKIKVGDYYTPIQVGEATGFGSSSASGFTDPKFNSSDEPTALVTEFGYPKIIGFKIYLNRTPSEKSAIVSGTSGDLYYFPIFVDDSNKGLLKKIRIVNPNKGNSEFNFNDGVYYNGDISNARKSSFVILGNSFSGYTGDEITDINLPNITADYTVEDVYIGLTRIDSSKTSAKMKSLIGIQFLDVSNNTIKVNSIFLDDPTEFRVLIGYNVSFGT